MDFDECKNHSKQAFDKWLGLRGDFISSQEYAAEKAAWDAGAEWAMAGSANRRELVSMLVQRVIDLQGHDNIKFLDKRLSDG